MAPYLYSSPKFIPLIGFEFSVRMSYLEPYLADVVGLPQLAPQSVANRAVPGHQTLAATLQKERQKTNAPAVPQA